MNKEELIRVLVLLSQLEGFTSGKFGDHCLPDWIGNELSVVCKDLANKIKETK